MSRNRSESECKCGESITTKHMEKPLTFNEYLDIIDNKYLEHYREDFQYLLISHWICPECGNELAIWLNRNTNVRFDNSYWNSFNDEE